MKFGMGDVIHSMSAYGDGVLWVLGYNHHLRTYSVSANPPNVECVTFEVDVTHIDVYWDNIKELGIMKCDGKETVALVNKKYINEV